jgi:hypothetical protein
VGLALSLSFATGVPAATTRTVRASGCDYTSIKAAIAAPTTLNGDTLAIAAGTYTEPGILVNKSLTLQGEAAGTTIVQAATTPNTARNRVFTIPNGVTATIWELIIRYGLAFNGGGLWNGFESTLTLANSIVANNPNGGDCYSVYGPITSGGHNLDSDRSCQLTASTDLPGNDPLLGPLQDNGGPTFTHALLPGSPAIDAIPWGANGCGTYLWSDQRWQSRSHSVRSPCDIGVYEVEVVGLIPKTVVCTNVTTGQVVTLDGSASAWDCEAAGLGVTAGDRVAVHVQGTVEGGPYPSAPTSVARSRGSSPPVGVVPTAPPGSRWRSSTWSARRRGAVWRPDWWCIPG